MSLDKSTFNRLVHQLRRNFVWSQTYKDVVKRCTIAPGVFWCEGCKSAVHKQDQKFAVDHVVPVGTLSGSLDEAADKIFCDPSNLMGLCGSCHYFKTRVDIESIKEKKKSLIDKIELGEI